MKDKGEDQLEESGAGINEPRLGERDIDREEPETETEEETTEIEQEETTWKPKTMHLQEQTHEDLEVFFMELQLEHPETRDAKKRELYEAFVRSGIEYPDTVAEKLEEIR